MIMVSVNEHPPFISCHTKVYASHKEETVAIALGLFAGTTFTKLELEPIAFQKPDVPIECN